MREHNHCCFWNHCPWLMTSGFQEKTPVTVTCGELPLPKPLQAMKLKAAFLRNSAIHPWGFGWTERVLVTVSCSWVTSTELQQLLILTVAEKTTELGWDFPWLQERHDNDQTPDIHRTFCVFCCRDLRECCCPRDQGSCHHPPVNSGLASVCSHSAALGLSHTPLSLLETQGCALDPPQGWTQPAMGRQRREGAQSHRAELRSYQAGVLWKQLVSFLWGTRLSNIALPFF